MIGVKKNHSESAIPMNCLISLKKHRQPGNQYDQAKGKYHMDNNYHREPEPCEMGVTFENQISQIHDKTETVQEEMARLLPVNGRTSRGKATLVIRLALPKKRSVELLSASEKANHGSIPAKKKTAKLSVPVSIGFSRSFKTTENTKIYIRRLARGVRRLHKNPPTESAKRPRISFLTKPQKRVLW